MEVDVNRKRIGLSMRMSDDPEQMQSSAGQKPQGRNGGASSKRSFSGKQGQGSNKSGGQGAMGNAFAAAFANAKNK